MTSLKFQKWWGWMCAYVLCVYACACVGACVVQCIWSNKIECTFSVNMTPLHFFFPFLQGYSSSETWYAVLDYGTNYCNLHNLIIGTLSPSPPPLSSLSLSLSLSWMKSHICKVNSGFLWNAYLVSKVHCWLVIVDFRHFWNKGGGKFRREYMSCRVVCQQSGGERACFRVNVMFCLATRPLLHSY